MNRIESLLLQLHGINSDDINNDMLEFYKTKYNFILFKINNLKNEEPLKIFKKKHKKWEQEIESLNNDLDDYYKKIKNIF